MNPLVGIASAALGLIIGWVVGLAVAARKTQRRRDNQAMEQHMGMVRALARTARPNIGHE